MTEYTVALQGREYQVFKWEDWMRDTGRPRYTNYWKAWGEMNLRNHNCDEATLRRYRRNARRPTIYSHLAGVTALR
jgi:hypothetical protein